MFKILESKVVDKIFSNHDMLEPNILDKMSVHVPINIFGSTRYDQNGISVGGQKIKNPYILESVWEARLNGKEISVLQNNNILNNKNHDANLCFEFSINFEHPKKSIIKKKRISVNADTDYEFQDYKERIKGTKETAEEYERAENMLSILKEVDPDIAYMRKVVSILAPYRSQEYMPWFNVIEALACMGEEYKNVGIEFSLRCPEKFNRADFDAKWINMRKRRKYADPSRAMGIIQYWAKQDNINKYNDIKRHNVHSYIMKEIYNVVNEGLLQHAQIAKILRKIVKNKFVVDSPKCEKRYIWYEFILSESEAKNGELLKWRKITDCYSGNPLSLEKYISSNLREVFEKIYVSIKNKTMRRPEGANKEEVKQYAEHDAMIVRNFKKTCDRLACFGFIKNCIDMARCYFSIPGFADEMDKDGMILGVGNGVLEFHDNGFVKLIKEYHTHKISKYTVVHYKPLDFNNTIVLYILRLIRNMFPDDKVESFNWFMHYLATSLDGNPKDSFLLLMYGQGNNGKSLITSLLEGVLGEDYSHSLNSTLLTAASKTAESATPELMKVMGRRLIKFSEVDSNSRLNIQTFKRLLGSELLSGRKLNEDTIQFLPGCIYIILLNALLEIPTPEEATWKRIKLLDLPYSFYPESGHMYEKSNKYHKPADPHAKTKLATVEAKEAFLSILVYYWQSLKIKYGGKINNVPHTYIINDTIAYRNNQDTLSCFINSRMVKTDKEYVIYMSEIGNAYSNWYEAKYRRKSRITLSALEESLKNSKIQSLLKKDHRHGSYMEGIRFLGPGEFLKDGEEYAFEAGQKVKKFSSTQRGDNHESIDDTIDNIINDHKSLMERIQDPNHYIPITEEELAERKARRKKEMEKNAIEFKMARKNNLRLRDRNLKKIDKSDDEKCVSSSDDESSSISDNELSDSSGNESSDFSDDSD